MLPRSKLIARTIVACLIALLAVFVMIGRPRLDEPKRQSETPTAGFFLTKTAESAYRSCLENPGLQLRLPADGLLVLRGEKDHYCFVKAGGTISIGAGRNDRYTVTLKSALPSADSSDCPAGASDTLPMDLPLLQIAAVSACAAEASAPSSR